MAKNPVNARSIAGAVPLRVAQWASPYIGIPFAELGASFSGCHCWGLVRLVLEREKGIEGLPDHGETSAADIAGNAHRFSGAISGHEWIGVHPKAACEFDCVLMTAMTSEPRIARVPGHVGIIAGENALLHIWRATDAVVMPLDHPRARNKIIGFYRHRSLM